jgi:hypothetical protein
VKITLTQLGLTSRWAQSLLAVALTTVLMIGSVEAAQIIGVGTGSCGNWTKDRRNPGELYPNMDGQWVLGFLSGMGWSGLYYDRAEILKGMDAEGVWAWVDNYCQAHPIKDMTDAALSFEKGRPRSHELFSNYPWSPLGVGTESCGSWIAARKSPDGRTALWKAQWAIGFLSGASIVHEGIAHDGKTPLKDSDARGVWAWIDNFCLESPVDTIADAAEFFDMDHSGH